MTHFARAFNLTEIEQARSAAQTSHAPAKDRVWATRLLLQHVMELGLSEGITQTSNINASIRFIRPVLNHHELASDLGHALTQIKASPLASTFQRLALLPIAEVLPEFPSMLKHQVAVHDQEHHHASQLQQEQQDLQAALDLAFDAAKKGHLPDANLQRRVHRFGSKLHQTRLDGIVRFARKQQRK